MIISDLETATAIAKRVTSKCKEYGIPSTVTNHFVILVSLVMSEIREENRKKRNKQEE